jgi:LmbE family N-acetylglucosaminyl deacetylase
MLRLSLTNGPATPKRILCLGAHCDDIEIGCGGTLLRLIKELPSVSVSWVTFSSTADRKIETEESAAAFLAGAAETSVVVHSFRDGFFPYRGSEIKAVFEELKLAVEPDLILTHYGHDAHQDHRVISELTWNTYRDHLILEYEIPKYDGDLGSPNFFVDLSRAHCTRKVQALMRVYGSQRSKAWFTEETFWGVLRLRGVEARADSGFAEGFYCRKVVV